jgi:hypothetical protein
LRHYVPRHILVSQFVFQVRFSDKPTEPGHGKMLPKLAEQLALPSRTASDEVNKFDRPFLRRSCVRVVNVDWSWFLARRLRRNSGSQVDTGQSVASPRHSEPQFTYFVVEPPRLFLPRQQANGLHLVRYAS